MKKIFATLTIALCMAAMGSCGGDNKSDKAKTELSSNISNATIKSKAESIVRRSADAAARGDRNAWQQIAREEQEFASKLTQSQIEYYNKCALEYGQSIMGGY